MRLNPESNTQVPKKLVIITGSSGTGKSTLAQALGKDLGCPVVSKDIYASVFPASHGLEYEEKYRPEVYELIQKVIIVLLSRGCDVVADVVYSKEVQIPGWNGLIEWHQQTAKRYNAIVEFIRVVVPEKTLRGYLIGRGSQFDNDKLSSPEGWNSFMREQPIYINTHPANGLVVRNDRPFTETFAEVKTFLSRPLYQRPSQIYQVVY
ncbi:MAG: AAA family ATPase [Candidatus Daviesbacteria bacterium]|nr:AAA family ATPase [Candidatus Daviesbacteria bacterium]